MNLHYNPCKKRFSNSSSFSLSLRLLALAGCVSSTLSVGPKTYGEDNVVGACMLLAVLSFAVVVSGVSVANGL